MNTTNFIRAIAHSALVRLTGRDWRPFRFWLPETLNRLRFPDFIMYQSRRDEVAAVIRQARLDGIVLRRDCYVVDPCLRELFKRAPRRKPHKKQNIFP